MITPKVKLTPEVVRTVVELTSSIGVPMNLLGYEYLKTAILYVLEDPNLLNVVTKELYPKVALEHGTTKSRAERAIRHAIEETFYRMGADHMAEIFGLSISPDSGKVTNSQFIALMAEKVRLKIGAYDEVPV